MTGRLKTLTAGVLLPVELAIAGSLMVMAIVIGPYFMIPWPTSGWAGALMLLAGGAVLAVLMAGPVTTGLRALSARAPWGLRLWNVIALGVLLQVVVALLTRPIPVSDGLTYLSLATKLAKGLQYSDPNGWLAFWPAGLPLYLAPFVSLFGATLTAIVIANVVLYAVGAIGSYMLGKHLFDHRIGVVSSILFTLWPSRLLTAGMATKENLTIGAVVMGMALSVVAMRSQRARGLPAGLGAGICFGIAALAQPGLLLFVLALPLCYRYAAHRPVSHFVGICVTVMMFAVLTLAPWHIRNCIVFEGKFCGVATNGGSVFYRANNPMATGEWTPEGTIPITHLPELEQNRVGFEYGKKWILENPAQFLALSVKKLTLLLRDDRFGAYWAIFRGGGGNHETSVQTISSERLAAYQSMWFLSFVFWIALLGLVIRAIWDCFRRKSTVSEKLLPLVYPLLYCSAVFSVFESDRRQHMIALAVLMTYGAYSLVGAQPDRCESR